MKGSRGTAQSNWPGGSRRAREIASGAFIVDRRGTVLGFDQGMEQLTGWPATIVVGMHKDMGCGHSNSYPLYEGTLTGSDSPGRGRELRLYCRDGSGVLAEVSIERLEGPGERLLVKVLGVLARYAPAVAGQSLVGFDSVTGLLDRNSFINKLDEEFARSASSARPLALVVADVDHLRAVNDQLGFDGGNQVLRKLAGILRVAVGEEEHLGRLGADEFGVILSGAGRGEARQFAAGLRTTAERFRFFPEREGDAASRITLSIGAASSPADADNAARLMERAYDALDEARSFGRNRVWCYMRRPRVPVEVPVFFDAAESLLVGYTRDLSPSGVFVQTSAPIDIGMRCALAFALPGAESKVHVVGRVVRSVPSEPASENVRIPGMGVEFERFGGPQDQRAIETFLHVNEAATLRPEDGTFSV
jgi:uncharacterized protein (TIGR02266 family)